MDLLEILMVGFFIIGIILFFKPKKKYPKWRQIEAEIYFNGSIKKDNPYDTGDRTHGLALTVDKKTGKARFRKQSKMILRHPFY